MPPSAEGYQDVETIGVLGENLGGRGAGKQWVRKLRAESLSNLSKITKWMEENP